MTRSSIRPIALSLLAAGLTVAAGCQAWSTQRPRGRMASLDQHTYASTPFEAKTVRLVDTRTAEELWSVDVPVDYKVVVRFYEDKSEDNQDFPDVMRWEIIPADDWGTLLENQMPVPSKHARRLEWELRRGPEYAPDERPAPLDIMPEGGVETSRIDG
tara:strand:+ start:84 stop:557 length:474 start_codon:yes stop_codon:yes gene_type:complete